MRTLVWSESALADFEQAILHLAQQDPAAARLVANRFDAAIRQLAEIPTGRPGRVTGTYEKSILRTPCIVAYALSEDALTILRVIHDRRDWPGENWPT